MTDFIDIFSTYGVSYIEEGKNVGRNEINISCPFCGDDPSYHLGINLSSGYWHCWRNPEHSGKSPTRLLTKTLGVSSEDAQRLSRARKSFAGVVAAYRRQASEEPSMALERPLLEMPEFYRPAGEFPRASDFLLRRGFPDPELISEMFDLRFTIRGDFKHRLIFPVRHDGQLRTWVGRATGRSKIRYISLSSDSDREMDGVRATHSSKESLLNHDGASRGGGTLFVVEGPMDCAKVEYLIKNSECHAVALSGVSMSESQKAALIKLARVYDRVVILLDDDFYGASFRVFEKLSSLGNKLSMKVAYPRGVSDPGDLSEQHRSWLLGD